MCRPTMGRYPNTRYDWYSEQVYFSGKNGGNVPGKPSRQNMPQRRAEEASRPGFGNSESGLPAVRVQLP